MKLSEFYKSFPDESTCAHILKCIREAQGVICKKCGNIEHYWKKDKKSFECKECNYRTSLKNGTIIEHSNLPLKYWLSTIAYINIINEKISALQLQKELGHNRYEPIWLMLKKIKNSSKTDNLLHKISDYIQINKTEIRYINKKNL
nr:transposase [Lutibacter citreus]